MKYSIIEDCSPYYIRFTFDGIRDIADYARSVDLGKVVEHKGYYHEFIDSDASSNLFSMLPMSDIIKFKLASIFTTPPAGGCGVHKDGTDHKVSFNIPLQVLDNECLTTWYTDNCFTGMPVETHGGYTRNIFTDWTKLNQFVPSKSMVAQEGEMILFNTEIFHAWHNNSSNTRKVLLLRSENPGLLSFYQVRKLLFAKKS